MMSKPKQLSLEQCVTSRSDSRNSRKGAVATFEAENILNDDEEYD